MDIFESLLGIDNTLIDWILQVSPSDAEDPVQRQAMLKVLAARTDVERALNTLVTQRVRLAAAGLTDAAKTLDTISTSLAAVDRDIAQAQTVLDLAGQAIQIATKVLTLLATF